MILTFKKNKYTAYLFVLAILPMAWILSVWCVLVLPDVLDTLRQTALYLIPGAAGFCFVGLLFYIKGQHTRLSDLEEKYHAIIHTSGAGAWEFHTDTRYLWCSPEYFHILGYDQKTFFRQHGMTIDDVWTNQLHPDDRTPAVEKFSRYVSAKNNSTYENIFRLKHKDGHWVWILSRGRALTGTNRCQAGVMLGTHTDITATVNAQMDLKRKHHQLSDLAFALAHHLRGPVARMLGLVYLANRDTELDSHWYLNAVSREVADLDKVLRSMTAELNEIEELASDGLA